MRVLIAIPVYNEERYVDRVLTEVRRHGEEILVVNDGSNDRTPQLLGAHKDLHVITHPVNRGYGAAVLSAMAYAQAQRFDALVTMDCDGQHEPARIPVLLEALSDDADIVSGSRYLRTFRQDTTPPHDRRLINFTITKELNERLGLELTDAFCGFKGYRVPALRQLDIDEVGWGMPLQLWVQASYLGLRIREVAVPLVYLDASRAFGGMLDNPEERLAYYRRVIEQEVARQEALARGAC